MDEPWDIPGWGLEDLAQAEEQRYAELLESGIWETREGELILIPSMTTEHIKNCIHKIYKSNGTWRPEYLRLFEAELRWRRNSQRSDSL